VRIDAHVHLWGPAELAVYEWMTREMDAIRRPFGPDELQVQLERRGFERAILVQTYSSVAETRAFLELAESTPFVVGVVGWADLTAPDVADVVAQLRAGPGGSRLVGIRHQVHDEPDPEWILRDDVRCGLRALAEAGLVYDLLLRTRELQPALATVRALPELRFVVDHIAKPPIASGELEPWAAGMKEIAGLEHVSCKLSGLVTEADWSSWTPADVLPYASRVREWFGDERLVFGSDWPVCTLAASYDAVVELAEQVVGADNAAVLGGNAERVYGLAP
jgi:L-fuconolactonase